MAAAGSLQTATAAISIVQLAYQTYCFVKEVANAHAEARILEDKTSRLLRLVKSVQSRLDIRRQIRGHALVPPDEEEIENTVHESLGACQQCFWRLNRKLRGLSPDAPLRLSVRIVEGFRFTISQPERLRQERALETNIQALTTSLHLLQLLEHDATGKRLDRLERSLNQAVTHLQLISHNPFAPAPSPVMCNEYPGQLQAPAEDADLLAVQSLSRAIQVARSTASSLRGSNFESDQRSAIRTTVQADTDESNDDSGRLDNTTPDRLPSYGDVLAADTPEPSQLGSVGLGIDEPMEVPVRSSFRPPELIAQFKQDYQAAAEKEYNRGNFATAEEYQKKAFDCGVQLEQQGHGPFIERQQMRRRLVDIFLKREKHGEAARELNNILQELEADASPDQKKYKAEIWMKLAKVHHCMFLATKDSHRREFALKNIETAEVYASDQAFMRLHELRNGGKITQQDELFRECVLLLIQISEDQGAIVEAESLRSLYLNCSQPPLSPTATRTMDQSRANDDDDRHQTQDRERQLALLDNPGRPRISNAIVFDLQDCFQDILENELASETPNLDERCRDRKWTPLMYVVSCDHKGNCSCDLAMEKLIYHGASLNATVGEGNCIETALHQAVSAGRDEKAHYLLKKGADKNACAPYTPLSTAVKKNQPQLVELLLGHGAEPPIDNNKWTLVHHAIASSAFDAFTVLIRKEYRDKINTEARCAAKKTPLLLCAEFADRPLSYAMAEELLKLHADPNALDETGRSPLYFATRKRFDPCQADRENFVKLLMNHGADWTKTPEKFRTAKSTFAQYPSIRAAMRERDGIGSRAEPRRKDSGMSAGSSDLSRRDSGSTFRSLETVTTRESTKSRRLRLSFGKEKHKAGA